MFKGVLGEGTIRVEKLKEYFIITYFTEQYVYFFHNSHSLNKFLNL